MAIHGVGIEPDPPGELLLRNISESNHGDFLRKSFSQSSSKSAFCTQDQRWTSWRTNLVNEKAKDMSDSFQKQRMSIGAQIKIIDVMQREEKQKEQSWHDEWTAAQRLLLAQEDHRGSVNDKDMLKELERRSSRTMSARVGGGFAYQTDEVDLGLEMLFEHKSAVPWTANSTTAATGPKVPNSDTGLYRAAKFPPSRDLLPASDISLSERSERKAGRASSTGPGGRPRRQQQQPRPLGAGANPWSTQPAPGRPPSGSQARRAAAGYSAARQASADRAAGGRAASPSRSGGKAVPAAKMGRSKTPPPAPGRERRATPPEPSASMPMAPSASEAQSSGYGPPTLERRWSF